MFDGYEPVADVYDEAFEAPGRPRRHYLPLLETLADSDLDAMGHELKSRLRKGEVTFDASPDGLFALDLVPRLLTAREWATIRAGIVQRARALDSFAADVYADRAIVAAEIVPECVIDGSAHYEPAMRYVPPPRQWVSVVGFDLVRNPDGEFVVLEDQIRMPSGLGYALSAREVLPAALGVPPPPSDDVWAIMDRLGETLRAIAPEGRDDPTVVVLSSGPDGAGWYEHERIGRDLGVPVVTLDQLECGDDDELNARVNRRPRRIDVVYQRTDEDRFTDEQGEPTPLGAALLGPCRAGNVACVNAPGSGIGDDKLVHAYVEEMVRFYLGEVPVLRSVETFDLGIAKKREAALERMNDLVFKPRGAMGGEGVVVWSESDEDERAEVRRALENHPEDLIAQRRVQLSCHPTLREGRLRPRRVDLRPYVIRAGGREHVVPGLSRVALEEGSLIVNSSRGGGVKDTWLTSAPGGGPDRGP
jgi:uncharacterized circularly permuted ATP-grasp superfamily protein